MLYPFLKPRNLLLTIAISLVHANGLVVPTAHGFDETGTNSDDHTEQILEIELNDKEILKGQLYLPHTDSDDPVKLLVVFIHGTGPGTYLNKRKAGSNIFNYFDYFGKAFNDRGIAFFSYNKRGVTMSDNPPYYDQVDREKFRKVVPHIEVRDLATIVDHLKKHSRLGEAKVALLGGSEGTMIAAMVAEKFPEKIDAILLSGYAHENIYDIIAWQFSGKSSMLNLNHVFDQDGDKVISKDEYESEDEKIAAFRKRIMQDTKFDVLDATNDGRIAAEDFATRSKPVHYMLLKCVENNNEEWIWNNYFRISVPWLREHFSLEANKTRLMRLVLPIYIFHGDRDPNVDVQGVYDLEKRFEAVGKKNLTTFVFEDHGHNLNFMDWVRNDKMPEGVAKIFEVASQLVSSDESPGSETKEPPDSGDQNQDKHDVDFAK